MEVRGPTRVGYATERGNALQGDSADKLGTEVGTAAAPCAGEQSWVKISVAWLTPQNKFAVKRLVPSETARRRRRRRRRDLSAAGHFAVDRWISEKKLCDRKNSRMSAVYNECTFRYTRPPSSSHPSPEKIARSAFLSSAPYAFSLPPALHFLHFLPFDGESWWGKRGAFRETKLLNSFHTEWRYVHSRTVAYICTRRHDEISRGVVIHSYCSAGKFPSNE